MSVLHSFMERNYTTTSSSVIVGSYSNCSFSILRNCQETIFQYGCIILRFYQQHMRVQISPHLHQPLLDLFDNSYLGGCEVIPDYGFDLHFPDG